MEIKIKDKENYYKRLKVRNYANSKEIERGYQNAIKDLIYESDIQPFRWAHFVLTNPTLSAIYNKQLVGNDIDSINNAEQAVIEAFQKFEQQQQTVRGEVIDKIATMDKDKVEENILQDQELRKVTGKVYSLGEDSKLYKLLMQSDIKTISRIIDTTKNKNSNTGALDAQFILESAPLELLVKMQEINAAVAKRDGRILGGLRDTIAQFCAFLNQVISQEGSTATSRKFKEAVEEILNLQQTSQTVGEDLNSIISNSEIAESFVELVNKSRVKSSEISL